MLKTFYTFVALAFVSTFFGSTYFVSEKKHQSDPLYIQWIIDQAASEKETHIFLTSGTFKLIAPLKLSSGICLEAIKNVVLTKSPCKKFVCQKISDRSIKVLTDVSLLKAFVPGTSVTLGITGWTVNDPSQIHTISSISRNVFQFEHPIPACNFIALDFPLITCDEKENIILKNLNLDLQKDSSSPIDSLFSSAIHLSHCQHVHILNCKVLNFHGTAFNLMDSNYVHIHNCMASNGNIGAYIGSFHDEKEETFRHNTFKDSLFEKNHTGIFFGYGAQETLCKNVTLQSCDVGISMGHRANGNTFEDCTLDDSYHGFYFREDLGFPIEGIEFSSVFIKNSRNSDLNLQTPCYIKGLESLSFSFRKVVNPFLLHEF